ncbi:gamma-glutamyl-gamma-aminobutyrate hydrolase family protein [Aquibaculum arenosum]|uniref:Type 1 glutamine amidotransferase n=1 Tax=Aquibaculum arenosum TaxID=3032591 RepID=A0ABT5YPL2_9PROT|nr:type 1 glutamine amidotransferase [Fodinicurvata sp. CAU 1616]MDF2096817.1 type 1 glutamine amidotransferase [Fodinicurvata sp. CAU 1616]
MRAPLIAVTSSRRRALFTAVMNRIALLRAGARSVRVYPGKQVDLNKVDGLLIGGGDDIDVRLYDQDLILETRLDPERDALEMEALALAEERNLPVLGICRGAQIMNVYYGGSLLPDIHALFEDLPRMRTALPRKWINLRIDSRLHGILGRERLKVNSLHHQAVDRLGRNLRAIARDDSGIVQAIENDNHSFLIGVQWHPELMPFHRGQQELFRRLVAAARGPSG